MAKKKIDDPSFLEFINLPLFKHETYPEYGDGAHATIPTYESKTQYMAFFKDCLEKLLLESNLPPVQVGKLKMVVEDFDNFSYDYHCCPGKYYKMSVTNSNIYT